MAFGAKENTGWGRGAVRTLFRKLDFITEQSKAIRFSATDHNNRKPTAILSESRWVSGGAKGTRTPDLNTASVAY